ncbi:hypothetical protein Tco_0685040 [Tanacetum coccineum]
MIGYYFYFPSENKIVVARYAEFLEKNLLSQEISGRAEELKEIQEVDTSPSKNTSNIPWRLRISNHLKGKLFPFVDPESDMWVDDMNAEMQSMKDNQIWRLVDLPPNSCLVTKGFNQTYGVDYEETFSPAADIRAIRILIDIYMVQPEGFVNPNHPRKNPREPHWTAVRTILTYLRNTKDMFLVYGGNPEAELRVDCYCSAGSETDRDDTKSQPYYVFILNGGAVD